MPGKDWHLPYEDDPNGGDDSIDVTGAVLAGGVNIVAGYHESEVGIFPTMVFRFTNAEGNMMTPVVLIVDDPTMKQLDRIVNAATYNAVRICKQKRQEKRRDARGN